MQQLRGTGVALVTPFHTDLSIDFEGLTAVIEHGITGGVDYFVMLGTTAESATLSKEEKQAVVRHIKSVVKGRKPLVLGVGGNDTRRVVEELRAVDATGITAILSVSPAYNKPTQEGIYAHYKAVAEASPLPVILYNVPSRTGSNMEAATTLRLARDFDTIIGIKEAHGSLVQGLQLLRERPDGFLILSGDDMLALPLVTAGGDGVISVIGQGLPQAFCKMIQNGLAVRDTNNARALEEAYQAQYALMPVIDMIFEEGNPAGIKSVLMAQNLCQHEVRLPLVKASERLYAKIQTYVSEI